MSLVLPVPILDRIESQFSIDDSLRWMSATWIGTVYASALYVLLVFAGRWYMHSRPAYKLRRVLLMWNTGLATFSLLGFMTFWPVLSRSLSGGIAHSVCWSEAHSSHPDPRFYLWAHLFTVSKLIEFGDTFFIVMRKTPLSFLHCYHHMTVLMYTWYSFPMPSAVTVWFGTLNYFIHALMYSYYGARTAGFKVPTWAAQCITILQMAQFLVGLSVTTLAFVLKKSGINPDCKIADGTFYFGLVIYLSYLMLFLHFFYQRYIRKK